MATVRGTGDDAPSTRLTRRPRRDDWDRWNSDRDRMIHSAAPGATPIAITLDRRTWTNTEAGRDVPDYGKYGCRTRPDDWAPYRDGNWVYEPYYGWTWVGYEPWGWAPYHYGRWFWYGNSWAWWPGPVGGFYRPFWAPAYVSFFGWGAGWGFGFGFGGWGGFGWLPIGPCDWFHPWWGGWRGRFGVVGLNRFGGHFGGFSAAARRQPLLEHRALQRHAHQPWTLDDGRWPFRHRRDRGQSAATREQLGGARMMTGNLPVVPTRASLSASGRAAAPSTIRNGGPQHFFGTQSTARPPRSSSRRRICSSLCSRTTLRRSTAGGRCRTVRRNRAWLLRGRGKPSAGAPASGRETAILRDRNVAARRIGESGNRGGFKTFTPPNGGNTHPETIQPGRSTEARRIPQPLGTVARPAGASLIGANGNRLLPRPTVLKLRAGARAMADLPPAARAAATGTARFAELRATRANLVRAAISAAADFPARNSTCGSPSCSRVLPAAMVATVGHRATAATAEAIAALPRFTELRRRQPRRLQRWGRASLRTVAEAIHPEVEAGRTLLWWRRQPFVGRSPLSLRTCSLRCLRS